MFYPEGDLNQHIDFKVTPWSWCSEHQRPERIDWAGINCKRSGWYRTEHGASEDNSHHYGDWISHSKPRRLHRCRAVEGGSLQLDYVERCACGAIRYTAAARAVGGSIAIAANRPNGANA